MKTIRTILACIRKADSTYNLISHGDKIVVGVSGGKDSLLLTYALCLYQKFSHTDFTIQPVTLDLGFPNFDPTPIKEYVESLGLTLIVSDATNVYPILMKNAKEENHLSCSICSRMKKAAINKVANDLGYNKVAFAHHAEDAIETYMMNAVYGGRIATFSPKMKLERANITFIRPLLLCRESDIIKTVKEENIPFTPSACPMDKHTTREDIKQMLNEIYHTYPNAKEGFLSMLSNYEQFDVWGDKIEYQIDQNGLILKPITTPHEMYEAIKIREEVFVEEQGFSIDIELDDETEEDAIPFLIKVNEKTIGTIRYRPTSEGYKIERMAILKEYRNQGYGKKAFLYLCDMIAKKYNPCLIYLNAQMDALDFYIKCGFTPSGETFFEGHKEHQKAIKEIK